MVCIHGHTRTTWWNLLIVIGKELFKRKAESKNEVRLFANQVNYRIGRNCQEKPAGIHQETGIK